MVFKSRQDRKIRGQENPGENPGTDGTFSGIVSIVARLARVVVAEVAHHVTQRGNARQFLLASEAERFAYLDLLREAVRVEDWSVVGYGVMSNHVHRVLIPHRVEAFRGLSLGR